MKFNIDSLVLQNNRVFAYGWMFDADAKVCQARLRVSLVDGTEVSLPVFHGKERPDVAEAFPGDKYSLFSGWMIYAAWAGAAATATALVGRLENGSEFECLMPLNTSADSATAQPVADSIGSLQHVRNGGATGQFSTEGAEVKSFAVDIIRSLLVAAQQDRCVLVIDHAMGGGANQFRRQWIAQRLRTRPFVLVLTFEIATLRYALEILTTHGSHRHLLGSDEPVTTLAESGLVDEVLYNDAVSFPRPEDLPNWLVAFKRVPGTILTLAVHDYLPVCPSQFLLNDSGRFCRIPPIEECLRCLPVNENEFASLFTSRHMPQWRKQWGAALAVADQILCFSPSSKALLVRAYPALDQSRITIEPHSIAAFDRKPVINLDAPLHIEIEIGRIDSDKKSRWFAQNLPRQTRADGANLAVMTQHFEIAAYRKFFHRKRDLHTRVFHARPADAKIARGRNSLAQPMEQLRAEKVTGSLASNQGDGGRSGARHGHTRGGFAPRATSCGMHLD